MKIRLSMKNVLIAMVCAVIIFYFGIKIYKEIAPKSFEEQQLNCLKMGSDYARAYCLRIIKK